MKIQIKHRFNASVLFEIETNNMRLAIEAAVFKTKHAAALLVLCKMHAED